MKRFYFLFCIICAVFFSNVFFASADVVVNEIAWMGTATNVNDEWIELYNSGTTDVVLDGWTLIATDGTPTINISGTVNSGGYFLLERTDDTTVPAITAGVIYTGALSNEGESLSLKDNTETVHDTVSMTSGWTAGNSTTKETMQRSGGSWITANGTPGAKSATTNSGTDNGTTDNSDTNNSSGGNTDVESDDETETEDEVFVVDPDPVYSARMIAPAVFIQQVPLEFASEVKKDTTLLSRRGRFEWSMGDGGSFVFERSTEFTYTYQEPGTYVVMLRYYSNLFKEKPDTIHKKTITVIPASVSVIKNMFTGGVTIKNTSTDVLDIGGWKILGTTGQFTFPSYTIVPKNGTVTIPFSIHHIPITEPMTVVTQTFFPASSPIKKTTTSQNRVLGISSAGVSAEESLFIRTVPINEVSQPSFPKILNNPWVISFFGLLIIGGAVSRFIFSDPDSQKNSDMVE